MFPQFSFASAWLDLFSANWITRFARRLSEWQAPALIALSMDRQRGNSNSPGSDRGNEDDKTPRLESKQHQRQPKGLGQGGALGPDAHKRLAETLDPFGCKVTLSTSNWVLRDGCCEARTRGLELANV